MTLSDDACDELNERISSLGDKFTEHMSIDDLNSVNLSPRFLSNCNALLRELQSHDVSMRLKDSCSTIEQIYAALSNRQPYFTKSSEHIQYKLLLFLVAEVQIERLAAQGENTAMDTASTEVTEHDMEIEEGAYLQERERSVLAFQLDKICKLLQVRVDASCNLDEVLVAVQTHVTNALQVEPTLLSDPPRKLLDEIGVFSAQQQAKLVAVEDMIHKDFALRRQMLLKRMEVTVESFLWSEKASCRAHEDEIRTAVRNQQDHLATTPRRYQLSDALEANVALLHEQSKKITGDSQLTASSSSSSAGAVKSIIKQILVGEVPDRGGRANEVRPKQLRAEVRRAFGGGGGGGRDGRKDNNNDRSKDGSGGNNADKSTSSSTGAKPKKDDGVDRNKGKTTPSEKTQDDNRDGGNKNKKNERPQSGKKDSTTSEAGGKKSNNGDSQRKTASANSSSSAGEVGGNGNNKKNDSGRQVVVQTAPATVVTQPGQTKKQKGGSGSDKTSK